MDLMKQDNMYIFYSVTFLSANDSLGILVSAYEK